MSLEWLVGILIGGGGVGAILSAYLTFLSSNKAHELNLLDRASEEIERLDKKIKELEKEIESKDNENCELKELIEDLRKQMDKLKLAFEKEIK